MQYLYISRRAIPRLQRPRMERQEQMSSLRFPFAITKHDTPTDKILEEKVVK